MRKAGAAAPEVLLLGHFLSQLFFTRRNLLHVLLPLFLLTTSITTILPLDVNADSINHFESVWNDMRDALSKGQLKQSLPLSSALTDIHATMAKHVGRTRTV